MPDQNAQITWREGQVPVSTQFDDPYFSLEDGAAETAYVFLAGNDLPERFRPDFHIAELGFGTGLNLLLAWDAWMRAGHQGPLHFTSFEAYPMRPEDMAQAHVAFPALDGRRDALTAAWDGTGGGLELPGLRAASTYTAAGFVRRALGAGGFEVTRIPGYGRKRHMTRARMPA